MLRGHYAHQGAAQVIAAVWANLTAAQQARLEKWNEAVTEWRARRSTEFFPPNYASGRYKRAPARMETVRRIAECAKDELDDVIKPFVGGDASFVERRRGVDADNPLLDLSHESLIRQWDRLRSWADAEADKVAFLRKVVGDAEAWSSAKRSRSFLRTGGHLSTLEEWWRENQPTYYAWAERYRLSEGEAAPFSRTC